MGTLITPGGRIVPEDAVRTETLRSGGPGGQHANKNETAVRVRIDLERLELSDDERQRLGGRSIEATARAARSQTRNRETAIATALNRLDDALRTRRTRRPTRPTKTASERRLQEKRRHSLKKSERRRSEEN